MSSSVESLAPLRSKAEGYAQVIRALMLRDMRTRFGGSHWGYAVLVMWPVAHVMILVAVMGFRGGASPLGDSALLFVATGAVPVLMCQYISNETMKALAQNRPLLYYPQVKIFDVMIARFIVEIIKGFTGLLVVLAILVGLGVDPTPDDMWIAVTGYLASILLGIGLGAVNIGIVSFFPGWMLGYILVRILLYITSGVFFLPNMMPEQIYSIMKWNPLTQISSGSESDIIRSSRWKLIIFMCCLGAAVH
jgi:capsular polysaccharide transport system permease protein